MSEWTIDKIERENPVLNEGDWLVTVSTTLGPIPTGHGDARYGMSYTVRISPAMMDMFAEMMRPPKGDEA